MNSNANVVDLGPMIFRASTAYYTWAARKAATKKTATKTG
jgi:hypothetical protein